MRRAIDIHEGDRIDESAFKALIRAAVALNTLARPDAPAKAPRGRSRTKPRTLDGGTERLKSARHIQSRVLDRASVIFEGLRGTIALTVTEIALRCIGAFYAFAGYMVVRVALTSRVVDRAIAAVSAEKPSPQENAQTLWHLASAVVVFACGVMLMLLLEAAVWAFLLSAAGQALYLAWLAPRHFDPVEPPDQTGRRQTTNAFATAPPRCSCAGPR